MGTEYNFRGQLQAVAPDNYDSTFHFVPPELFCELK
jgi:hypothetical protein